MKKSFEDILKEKTNHFELLPKANLWHNIEEEIRLKKKKRLLTFVIIPVLLTSIGISFFYCVNNNQEIRNKIVVIKHNTLPENKDINLSETRKLNIQTGKKNRLERDDIRKLSPPINKINKKIQYNGFENNISMSFKEKDISKKIKSYHYYADKKTTSLIELEKKISDTLMFEKKGVLKVELKKVDLSNLGNDVIFKDSIPDNINIVKTKKDTTIPAKLPNIMRATRFIKYLDIYASTNTSNSFILAKNQNAQNAKKADQQIKTWGVGIEFAMQKNKHSFYTGLGYFTYGYKRNYVSIIENTFLLADTSQLKYLVLPGANNIPSSSSSNVFYNSVNTQFVNKYTYLSLPLGYSFQFIQNGKFGVDITSNLNLTLQTRKQGLTYNTLVNSYETINTNFNKSNSFGFNAGFGVNFQYGFSKNWSLLFKPQIGISLSKMDKTPIESRHKFYTIGFGLRYFIKK